MKTIRTDTATTTTLPLGPVTRGDDLVRGYTYRFDEAADFDFAGSTLEAATLTREQLETVDLGPDGLDVVVLDAATLGALTVTWTIEDETWDAVPASGHPYVLVVRLRIPDGAAGTRVVTPARWTFTAVEPSTL